MELLGTFEQKMKKRERFDLVLLPSMADVPPDILINHIFTRLPVKSLLRCRCVCKQWLCSLTQPEFIKMHVKAQCYFHPKILFGPIINIGYLCRPEWKAFNGAFYMVDLESGVDVVRLPGFSLKDYVITRTFGYCNGMLCAEVLKKSAKNRHLLFGNPSTGVYKMLPEPIEENPLRNLLVGFGYDSSLDDYKFVRVDDISRNPHIFSVQSNSWRTIVGVSDKYSIEPREYANYNLGSAFGRSIYWLVPRSNMIVGFDLKDEEFSNVPLPCDLQKDKLSLKLVGGTLCIINICENNNEVVMWSMSKEEENGKNSWIKMMTVTISAIDFRFYFLIHPLSYMKDGKILFCLWHHEGNNFATRKLKFVLIDPKTKVVENFTIQGIISNWFNEYTFQHQTTYVDSFVSPY